MQEKEVFKNLVCEPVKAKKRGSPVVGYIFTFDKEEITKREIPQQTEHKADQPKQEQTAPKASKKEYTKPKEQQKKSNNRFNDFPQRDYSDKDIAELEKLLLRRPSTTL